MFICSVNTILFNANPLLRYDGYYVMADWLEIPNLRIKSTQFFAYLFQEKVLGLEIPVQSYMPRSRRSLFVTYAIASYLYRWVVTFSILFFLSQFLKPYKLQSISYDAGGRLAGPAAGDAGLPDGQVRSHAREDAQGEKGTRGRLRGGGRRHRRRDPPDPDPAAGPGDPGPDGGQARRDLRRGRGPARRAQGPRRRVGQEGHRPGHALQPREAEGADPDARTEHDVNFAKAVWYRPAAPSARTGPRPRSTSRWPRTSSRPSRRSTSRSASSP